MADKPLRDHWGLFELPDKNRKWVDRAACNGSSANFFPTQMGEKGVKEAIAICNSCVVRVNCLQYALNNSIAHGIWGGLTARGRRELSNAVAYVKDPKRQEHKTAEWYKHYTMLADSDHVDPVRRTAQTLGLSKATVYHHLRIDRLAREKTDELEPKNNDNDQRGLDVSDSGTTAPTDPIQP